MRIPDRLRAPLKKVAAPWLRYRDSREFSAKNIARRNDRDAYNLIYANVELLAEYLAPARLEFYERVADVCAAHRPCSIVDVGCGTGHLLAAIVRRLPNLERVVGIDFAASAVSRLRENVPSAEAVLANLYDIEAPSDPFDLVVCTEVLEHVAHPVEALDALARLGRGGGHLVATVPDGEVDSYEGHVNFWSYSEFERFLQRIGLVEVRRLSANDLLGIATFPDSGPAHPEDGVHQGAA